MDRDALVCESHNHVRVDDPDYEPELGVKTGPSSHPNRAEHSFRRVPILTPELERPTHLLQCVQEATLKDTTYANEMREDISKIIVFQASTLNKEPFAVIPVDRLLRDQDKKHS